MTASIENHWIARAKEVACDVLSRHAGDVDRTARWPQESLAGLGQTGLLGLSIDRALGGAGEGPATFAGVACALAEQCASTAMIYVMHVSAAQVIAAARAFGQREAVLRQIALGKHLTTLALSEKGSRS